MTTLSIFIHWSGQSIMLGEVLFYIGIAIHLLPIHLLRHGHAVNESPYSPFHVLIAVALMLVLFGLVGLYARRRSRGRRHG